MAKTPFDLKGKTVFVAGHRGMVGGALMRRLAGEGAELLTVGRREVDLRDQAAVDRREGQGFECIDRFLRARDIGREPATPDEARKILSVDKAWA